MAEKKMTNIRLDPALWARVKGAAGQRGVTLERWVTEALEAQLCRGEPAEADAAAPGTPAGGAGAGATAAAGAAAPPGEQRDTPEDPLQALHWRVEALEHAVDYLAGVVGAGFPLGGGEVGAPGRPGAAGAGETDGGTPPQGNGAGRT